MAVVERRGQLDRLRQQHAVAEHVARHVAAAGDADRVGLYVDAHFGEVAPDRKPRTLGGDAHRLVVITLRPAARERVAEPKSRSIASPLATSEKVAVPLSAATTK